MADTVTTNYNFVKPEVGGSSNTWGDKLNGNWDDLDALLKSLSDDLNTVADGTTAAQILVKLKTVDGAGSGLDADVLDGQEGAFYRNASNLNAGTVADARLSANVPLKNAANIFTAALTALQSFISSTAAVVIATTGAGSVYLRPNGAGSGVGQTVVDSAGNVNIAGDLTVTGGNVTGTASGNVPNARIVTAGNGLTGGGALNANIALNVGAGAGIAVAADTVGVDATVWRDGNPPSGAQIGSVNAGLAFGAVGSYVFGWTDSKITDGSTYAGSVIYPGGIYSGSAPGADGGSGTVVFTRGPTALAGTWRAMGRNQQSASYTMGLTLFMRIA